MAHLAIVGSCSVNGVSKLHTDLLKGKVLRDFAEFWPSKFNNKTNGITPRRWLLKANPGLSRLITETIGDGWITELEQLRRLEDFVDDHSFRKRFRWIKECNKASLAQYIAKHTGLRVSPSSLFDVQIKRLHEYKRQLLLALYIIVLYCRVKTNPALDIAPRTFLISGKAAPGYEMAKLIIKLIHQIAETVNRDPVVSEKVKVVFLPNYRVSLAEKIIPAADLSEQISLAGTEASGTGNMKLQVNGALTIGTLDGANVEIFEEVGPDNIFIFGLAAQEVEERRRTYNPWTIIQEDPEIRRVIQLIEQDFFSILEPGIFKPILRSLLDGGDRYMVLAELKSYIEAQSRVDLAFRDTESWDRKAIINVAKAGRFSSDRTIRDYASEIWHVRPCPIAFPSESEL
jgi:starch phosphorylase